MAPLVTVYKRQWEVKDGTTTKQIQVVVGARLKLETSSLCGSKSMFQPLGHYASF